MLSGEGGLQNPQKSPQLSTQILGIGYLVVKEVMVGVIKDFFLFLMHLD